MKRAVFLGVMLVVLEGAGAVVCAAQGPAEEFASAQIDKVETDCRVELDTYCKTVTPGGGRKMACLYSHYDKLSDACELAFYDSAEKFQAAAEKINDIADACLADMEKFCSKVAAGEGRVLQCLKAHATEITSQCAQAVKDLKLES